MWPCVWCGGAAQGASGEGGEDAGCASGQPCPPAYLGSKVPLLALTRPPPPPPAGYISGIHYKKLGGTNWVNNVLLTTVLFCGPVLVTFSYLNTVAIFYRVRQAGLDSQ